MTVSPEARPYAGIHRLAVARALLSAPGWARVGLTSVKPSLREDAALELAKAIEAAAEAGSDGDQDQLQLTW